MQNSDCSPLSILWRTVFMILFFAGFFAVGKLREWVLAMGVNKTTLDIVVVIVCFVIPVVAVLIWAFAVKDKKEYE